MSYSIFDFLGNVGVALILAAYLALQTGRLRAQSIHYSTANALGALLILVSLFFAFNLSAFVIESAWLLISLFGVYRCLGGSRDELHDNDQ